MYFMPNAYFQYVIWISVQLKLRQLAGGTYRFTLSDLGQLNGTKL
jgi:hypothetical protein